MRKYRSEDRMRWTRAEAKVACQGTDAKVQERRQDEIDKILWRVAEWPARQSEWPGPRTRGWKGWKQRPAGREQGRVEPGEGEDGRKEIVGWRTADSGWHETGARGEGQVGGLIYTSQKRSSRLLLANMHRTFVR